VLPVVLFAIGDGVESELSAFHKPQLQVLPRKVRNGDSLLIGALLAHLDMPSSISFS
jgi:hypothetical protein